jgi:hypothetical protein
MKITDEQLDELFKTLELEQPSMSFSRNVMDRVKLEIPPVALKTKVDSKVIYGIAAIFICSIAAIFAYVIVNADLSYSLPKINVNLESAVQATLTSGVLKGFLFADAVIALILFDRYWKFRRFSK